MSDDIVYSTESGDLRKREPKKKKKRASAPSGVKNDGVVRVIKETKGRGGKVATVVYGLPYDGLELSLFAKKLKQHCGTGGSEKDGLVIIQGDNVDKVVSFIDSQGLTVRRAGG